MIVLFKKALLFTLCLLPLSVVMASGKPLHTPQTILTPVINVSVKGMVCDFCARGLEKVFTKQEQVRSIEVDLANNNISLNLKPGTMLSDDVITKLVVANGISVEGIKRAQLPVASSAVNQRHTPVATQEHNNHTEHKHCNHKSEDKEHAKHHKMHH